MRKVKPHKIIAKVYQGPDRAYRGLVCEVCGRALVYRGLGYRHQTYRPTPLS